MASAKRCFCLKKQIKYFTFVATYVIIYLQLRETKKRVRWQGRKGEKMEEQMTDYQFQTILKMILEILDNCKDIEEAKEKVKALLNK